MSEKGLWKRTKKRCPSCLRGGYRLEKAADGRPQFVCTACGATWTCGLDGGEWLADAARSGGR